MSDDAIQRSKTVPAGNAVDVWFGNATQFTFQITIENLAQEGTGVQVNIQPKDVSEAPFMVLDLDPNADLPSGPHRFQVGRVGGAQVILQAKPATDRQTCTVTYTFKWD